jgi:hypothetical protein
MIIAATEHAEAALLAFDREMQRPDGNLTGRNQHSTPPEGGTVDNIHSSKLLERPAGTSAQAGLRRLRKAADGGDERASELLGKVIDATSDMSVHRACVAMGWRKELTPLKAVQAAWRKADAAQREEIGAWIDWVRGVAT